jgi:hypothetical protein
MELSPARRSPGSYTGSLVSTAFLLMACEGFVVYAIGFITPYLESELGAEPWVAALPNSAMAVGLVAATWAAHQLRRLVGPRVAIRIWAAIMGVAALLLAVPVSMVPVLAGALLFGLSVGGVLLHVNSSLGTGPNSGMLLARANLASVIGGLIAPLAMSAAARSIGWSLGSLIPVPFILVLALTLPGSPARDDPPRDPGSRAGSLSRDYWLCWAFVTLCVAVEFSFVAWGARFAQTRTSLSLADATGLASLYVVGMVTGRALVSAIPWLAAHRLHLLRAGIALVVAGAVTLDVAASPAMAGLGLLLGGLGMSPAYPLGASVALSHAPGNPVAASARLTAASGIAILVAPLAVGLVTAGPGIEVAWLLVIGVALLALTVAGRMRTFPAGIERARHGLSD